MSTAKTSRHSGAAQAVSPNNPCPFLRAMVAQGMVKDDVEPISKVTDVIAQLARTGEGQPQLPRIKVYAIALLANGLAPTQLTRNALAGLRLNQLRDGPLDKHGVGSGILSAMGEVNEKQLKRLNEFASEKTDANGGKEMGLDLPEITRMMDANFARAEGKRRSVDRKLMDGEWPVLLMVMGKDGKQGRYLSVDDVRKLFVEQRFPERMMKAL